MLCGSFSFTLMAVLAHTLLRVDRACDWQTVAMFRAGLVAVFGAIVARLTHAKLVFWPWRLWVRSVAGSCSMVCTFYVFATTGGRSDLTNISDLGRGSLVAAVRPLSG